MSCKDKISKKLGKDNNKSYENNQQDNNRSASNYNETSAFDNKVSELSRKYQRSPNSNSLGGRK